MVKLIVHVGHGKTGSSSIQKTLLNARETLESRKIKYLGLMLEHAGTTPLKNWQRRTGSDLFFDQVPNETAQSELAEVLHAELLQLAKDGYTHAIWSNEWIFERPTKILPVLADLATCGYNIEIQVYLRRHDKWAVSAYTQWGLRHKTYQGAILPFTEWMRRRGAHFAQYFNLIQPWLDTFQGNLRVMNFDATGNVTEHFLRVNEISDIPVLLDNVSPSDADLLGAVVYNSAKVEQVPTDHFGRIAQLVTRFDETGSEVPPLDQLMPDAGTLNVLVNERAEDIEKVNALLQSSGEPPFSFDSAPRTIKHPSAWEIDRMLLKLVFGLSEELMRLQGEVADLRQRMRNESLDGVDG
ncbi:hypothetical protein [Phaeobacter gallaeciensis]|uniref:hypothetical protein n=1 Tax=Phaeobacter gallaeciensis TaxID=60890 RepID=UPI00237F2D5A|nr:hypothetical protein [Phaeobacter gallaeciensis]MDE4099383.1 hypothetical protein [Phaeobacter gallaeciensis]MDE4108206.1 hypothetical protein [Phaeobacter gallaeciensis]MDE4112642.1 hypothetical protein [Phaeobacter gallaeciensis]MDE4117113.1 hypothetical protein [Phaeobacter gallaeciensis]MDE4121556.1 hypothetical protein [Phaeobacter gallaeciensis]